MTTLDANERFVDAGYVRGLLGVDARTARDVVRAAGGRKIAGRYRVRHARLAAYLDGPDSSTDTRRGETNVAPARLTAPRPSVRDQRATEHAPPAGWWREEAST